MQRSSVFCHKRTQKTQREHVPSLRSLRSLRLISFGCDPEPSVFCHKRTQRIQREHVPSLRSLRSLRLISFGCDPEPSDFLPQKNAENTKRRRSQRILRHWAGSGSMSAPCWAEAMNRNRAREVRKTERSPISATVCKSVSICGHL